MALRSRSHTKDQCDQAQERELKYKDEQNRIRQETQALTLSPTLLPLPSLHSLTSTPTPVSFDYGRKAALDQQYQSDRNQLQREYQQVVAKSGDSSAA